MTIPIRNQQLLTKALTHRSYLNEAEGEQVKESNERLEFLGDAVLELLVSDFLFKELPDKPEGDLSSIRSALVRTTTLAEIATQIGLGEQLLMSKGEIQTGGRTNPSLLADSFEAILGALFLDQGLEQCEEFLRQHLYPLLPNILEQNLYRDFKSTFQEKVQASGHPTPSYKIIHEEGPDHQKTFTAALVVGDKTIATGTGNSKQLAQQEAARAGLERLDRGEPL